MQTVRSQLFEGITNEECARMFQCFGAREAGYEAAYPTLTRTTRDSCYELVSVAIY